MKTLQENEYKCAYCHNIYEKGWTDDEAQKERDELWDNPSGQWDVVCDDCFNGILNPEKNLGKARSSGYKK